MNLRTAVACVALAPVVFARASAQAPARHFPATADLQVMLNYLVEDKATPGIVIGSGGAILSAHHKQAFVERLREQVKARAPLFRPEAEREGLARVIASCGLTL